MKQILESAKRLEALKRKMLLDLSANDVRIIVGCFRAVAYQAERDGEQYLNAEALELKSRLESIYKKLLEEDGNQKSSPRH